MRARPECNNLLIIDNKFQYTRPCGRDADYKASKPHPISIHSPMRARLQTCTNYICRYYNNLCKSDNY